MCIVSLFLPGVLHGSLLAGKIFLTPSDRLVGHKIRHKAHKETTSFIPNGGVAVQGKVIRITVQNGVLAQLLSCQLYMNLLYQASTPGSATANNQF